jgi:hypothetical protein
MFDLLNSINLDQLHKMIIILLILSVIFYLIRRKRDNRILCEVFKLLFIFFISVLVIIGINLFGETVGMKVVTI